MVLLYRCEEVIPTQQGSIASSRQLLCCGKYYLHDKHINETQVDARRPCHREHPEYSLCMEGNLPLLQKLMGTSHFSPIQSLICQDITKKKWKNKYVHGRRQYFKFQQLL